MPEPKLNGKSRDDLATIAVVSGLLRAEEAAAMSKTELLKYLKAAETAAEPVAEPAAKRPKAAGRKPEAEQPKEAPQKPAAAEQPKEAARKPAIRKPAAKKAVEAVLEAPISAETAFEAVSQVPATSETTSELVSDVVLTVRPTHKPAGRPVERPVSKPISHGRSNGPSQGRSGYNPGKPQGKTSGQSLGDRNARNPVRDKRSSTGKNQPPQPTRPMRVKMFGIPINPMAAQSDEHEQAMQQDRDDLLLAGIQSGAASPYAANIANRQSSLSDEVSRTEYDESENTSAFVTDQDGNVLGLDEEGNDVVDLAEGSANAKEKAARKDYIESGESITGVLEIMPDGYGFLRRENYIQGAHDAYVPPQYVRRFNLRPGDLVTGPCKKQRDNDRYQALLYIKEINGEAPEKMLKRPHFDRLTPIYPDERYILETLRNELSTRIIDLVSPIGKGQRGMIVSPPKAGKTILLQKIANAISTNNPEVKLIVLLIDERPEEVTDMQRSINGEVVFSTFDKTPENHVKITELVLERAMRLVELKQDVVILLDSMTRLGRAYNLTITPTGRTLSGGLDPAALYGPKRFFGAARNIENGGSLTIIATSLIETGSRMDEVIFEEFKGTGNMEVLLDRKLSEKRIFPAIDINKSGTRREELLLSGKELDAVWTIRKAFGQLDTANVTETIINLLLKTQTNQQFISSINVSFNDKNVFDAMRGTRPSSTQNGSQNGNGN